MYGGGRSYGRSPATVGPVSADHFLPQHEAALPAVPNAYSSGYDHTVANNCAMTYGSSTTPGSLDTGAPKHPIPFRKNFYNETANSRAMTMEQSEQLRRDLEITLTKGPREIKPVVDFADAAFPKDIEEKLKAAGFTKPSPIQAQAWPILLSGHDFIGIAETGSGKTLAFLLPAVVHIEDQPPVKRNEGPIALVMAPTRELVEQIKVETNRFASRLRSGVAYGGASRKMQLRSIRDALDILVACPGRLIDYMERQEIFLNRVTYLVLDEADHMLDMGFEPQIRKIVWNIRPDRQTVMFSATWPKEVQTLARDLCTEDPVHVTIGCADLKANHNVKQIVIVSEADGAKHESMLELLSKLCQEQGDQRILIFTETKRGCDILTRTLKEKLGADAACIHGDKEQRERTYVLEEFRSGRTPILVATDVASRGLDIKDVRVVINYDMPNQIEDYVHRIGRTGRAGATGTAYTFITQDKGRLAGDLIRVMSEAHQVIPPELSDLATRNRRGGGPQYGRRYNTGRDSYRPREYGNFRGGYGPPRGKYESGPFYSRPPPNHPSAGPTTYNNRYYGQQVPYNPPDASAGGYNTGISTSSHAGYSSHIGFPRQ